MRTRSIDYLLLVLVYVIVISLPYFSSLSSNDTKIVSVIFQVLFGTGILAYLGPRLDKPRLSFHALPLFLFAFLNMAVIAIQGINIQTDYMTLVQEGFLSLGTVFAEELLFRQLFATFFDKGKRWTNLFLSSLLFALPHAISFLGSPSLGGLLSIGYTFVLGLVLWIVYESGFGFLGSFLLHLLFNLLMGDVFAYLGGVNSGLAFYLVNLIGGLLVVVYGLFVYWKPKKL